MKKQEAFTLIELIVAMAILVIIVGMMAPLMSSITKSNKKTQEISNLDLNIGKSIDIFKKAVRSSKPIDGNVGIWNTSGSAIYLSNTIGVPVTGVTTQSSIVINVPKEITSGGGILYKDEKVIFYLSGTNLMLNSTYSDSVANFSTVTEPVLLVENVMNAEFTYSQNIATIYLKVKMDKNKDDFKEIRDAGVTRINIQF